jgi:hypothetical protein
MTLNELLEELYRRLALPNPPNLTEATRLTSFLNITHRQILALPGMESLRDSNASGDFQGTWFQALPGTVHRVEGVFDRENNRRLQLCTFDEIWARDPGLTATGIPDSYVLTGLQQGGPRPTAPCQPIVLSTSPVDTGVVHLEGLTVSGWARDVTQATLTGATPVTVPVSAPYLELTKFYSDFPAVGIIQCVQDTPTGLLIGAILPGTTYSNQTGILLHPAPAGVIHYTVVFARTIQDLVDGADVPFLPEDFHWLLVEGALLKEWTRRDDDRRVAAEREYAKGLSALKWWVQSPMEYLPVSGRRMWWRSSRYGSQYPATWS